MLVVLIGILIGVALGVAVGVVAGSRILLRRRRTAAEAEIERATADARRAAEAIRREAQVEAREEALRLRGEVEREVSQRHAEATKAEERVATKEQELDRKLTELERREQGFADREAHVRTLQEELKAAKEAELRELERVAGLTAADAKRQLLERSEELVRHEMARMVRRSEEHTSELQSRQYLVCRLLLEKKKRNYNEKLVAAKRTRLSMKRCRLRGRKRRRVTTRHTIRSYTAVSLSKTEHHTSELQSTQ